MKISIGNKIILAFLAVIFTVVLINGIAVVAMKNIALREWVGTALSAFSALLIGAILSLLISRGITRELRNLVAASKNMGSGDLTKDVKVNSQDEIGELADGFNQMVANLREIVKEVRSGILTVSRSAVELSNSAQEMNASTEEIAATVEHMARGAEQQASLLDRASKLMRDLASFSSEIAARARAAADAASEAGYSAQSGSKVAQEAMEKLKGAFDVMESSSQGIKGFSEKVGQVGTIVDVITKIAQQTHLLALNATIEAARAGDYGKGFAVVAEEVRKLAAEVAASAEKISDIIKEIWAESSKVLNSMEMAGKEVSSGRDLLASIGRALDEIVLVVIDEVKKVQEISQVTQKQTQSAEQMVATIDEIAKVAMDNAASSEQTSTATMEQTASMEQMADAAQRLSMLGKQLDQSIAKFRVDEQHV
ncbi:MAG: methyl-accepting chemotaxis protein [candidate division NC10 bacterium]|nr:methyl-accepting chemotaxis protein [candidate division NC10 bacterium]